MRAGMWCRFTHLPVFFCLSVLQIARHSCGCPASPGCFVSYLHWDTVDMLGAAVAIRIKQMMGFVAPSSILLVASRSVRNCYDLGTKQFGLAVLHL